MGGFPHYGVVNEDYVMIKGACPGVKRRVITLRKTLFPQTTRSALEEVKLKVGAEFILGCGQMVKWVVGGAWGVCGGLLGLPGCLCKGEHPRGQRFIDVLVGR